MSKFKKFMLFWLLTNIVSCFESSYYIHNTSGVVMLSSNDPESSVVSYIPYAKKVKILKEESIKYKIGITGGGIANAFHIQVNDKEGWIFERPINQKPDMNLYYKVISENGLFMREKPSLDAKPVILIPYLSSDKAIEMSDVYNTIGNKTAFWMKVKYKNNTGWIFTGFVEIQKEETYRDETRNEWKRYSGFKVSELKEYHHLANFDQYFKSMYKAGDYEILVYAPIRKENTEKSFILFKNIKSGKVFYDDSYTEAYVVKPNYPLDNTVFMSVSVCRNCDASPVKLVFLLEESSVKYFYFSETQLKSYCENSMFGLSSDDNHYILNKVNDDKSAMYILKKHVSCRDNSVKKPLHGFNESILYNDTYFTNEMFVAIKNENGKFESTFHIDSGIPVQYLEQWTHANTVNRIK